MTRSRTRKPAGFSIAELLIAIAIVSVVLSGALVALDASFRGYQATADGASTHVVSRLVMHRMVAMVRTGEEFGPFPSDVLDPDQNPIRSNFIEFVSFEDPDTGERQITRLETRADPDSDEGLDTLWFQLTTIDPDSGEPTVVERPLLNNVVNLTFELEYGIGPSLKRATIDFSVMPTDDLTEVQVTDRVERPPMRMVASATPRNLID